MTVDESLLDLLRQQLPQEITISVEETFEGIPKDWGPQVVVSKAGRSFALCNLTLLEEAISEDSLPGNVTHVLNWAQRF